MAILTGLVALLLDVAPTLISWFVRDSAAREKALKDFYAAIAEHAQDGLTSALQRESYQRQLDELKKIADERESQKGG